MFVNQRFQNWYMVERNKTLRSDGLQVLHTFLLIRISNLFTFIEHSFLANLKIYYSIYDRPRKRKMKVIGSVANITV